MEGLLHRELALQQKLKKIPETLDKRGSDFVSLYSNKIFDHKTKKSMKTVESYEAPLVEIIEVEVEKGFATSNGTEKIEDGENYPFV